MKKKTKEKLKKIVFLAILILVALLYRETNFDFSKISEKLNFRVEEKEETVEVLQGDSLKVYFLDVGQADSILITSNGENMLIDAGNNEDGLKLVSYLHSIGITNFKYVVGTHAHEDHIGGMDDIIKNFSIDNFYMPDVVTTTKTFEDVLDALDRKQLAFQTPNIDDTFSLAKAKFVVLHVSDDDSDLNDSSIVLRMTYGNASFLFMGDATSKVEEKIIAKDIKSDVLKVAHHGSQYSTTTAFLKKVAPKYAVIEVGRNNTYKHPKSITLKKLKEQGSIIYRTDEDGTVVATTDGATISFEKITTDTNG